MKAACASLLFALAATLTAALGLASGDISGTWVITKPINQLTTLSGQAPPLTNAALTQYRAHLAAAKKGDRSWDPVANCKPPGEPRTLLEMAWPFEIMQSEHRVDFLFQWNRLDRAVPIIAKQPDYQGPYYFGQSIAHWDVDTFVVEVMGEKPNTFLDPSGLPHGDDLQLTERFRLIDDGKTLEARIHVVDPATYSAPWDTVLTFRRLPAGTRIQEDVCIERLKLKDYATLDNSLEK